MSKNEISRPKRNYPSLFDVFRSSKNLNIVPHRQGLIARLLHRRILDAGEAKATAAQVDAQVETAEMLRDAQVVAARERISIMVDDVRLQCEEERLKVKLDAFERVYQDAQERLTEIASRNLRADLKGELLDRIEQNVALALERIENGAGITR